MTTVVPPRTNRRTGRPTVRLNTYIEPATKDGIEAYARRARASTALVVEEALQEFLERHADDPEADHAA